MSESANSSSYFEDVEVDTESQRKAKTRPCPPPPSSSNYRGYGTSLGTQCSRPGAETSGRKRKGNPLETTTLNKEAYDKADELIARMFYASGLPFHLARSPYFRDAVTYLANTSLPDFIAPGYNSLKTTLLQKERVNVEKLLAPIKGRWPYKGVTIVSDGWTDAQKRPLINFMAVTDNGPMFIKAMNCEGEYKVTSVANLIKEVIEDIGPANVVQVIMDDALLCKAVGMLLEDHYPHIFWTPCMSYTLNLALNNICGDKNIEANIETYDLCSWIADIVGDVIIVKNFVTNHAMKLVIYNEFVNLKSLSIAETRFASTITMLRRFKLVKQNLQAMVISEKWSTYREDDMSKAMHVKKLVLSDIWWDKIDYILAFTSPIYEMLQVVDSYKPSLHLIHDMWDTMIKKVKKVIYHHEAKMEDEESPFFNVVYSILVDQRNKSITPLHCLAHSLNPLYYTEKWLNQFEHRLPPHRDSKISDDRNKCLKRLFPDDRIKVLVEFAKFAGISDSFSNTDSILDRGEMDPKYWWQIYGAGAPLLQSFAIKLFGQPCSSSCSEKNWSTYSFIHSLTMNKSLPQHAEDLVYVHTNLRLLSRQSLHYEQGGSKMWDVSGDAFGPFDGVGELQVANLSLDEPEMEVMVFDNEK